MNTLFGIIVGLLILSLMMIVHELGHFIAGRLLGFKILSYNIFMGPIIWKKVKNGIMYAIRLFPIGASVEFDGELREEDESREVGKLSPDNPAEKSYEINKVEADEDDPKDFNVEVKLKEQSGEENEDKDGIPQPCKDPNHPGLFYNRPRFYRAIVIFMGPFVNFLTAFLAFVILFAAFGTMIPVVDDLEPAGVASKLDLHKGDRIVAINGEKVRTTVDYAIARHFSEQGKISLDVIGEDGAKRKLEAEPELSKVWLIDVQYDRDSLTLEKIIPKGASEGVLEKGDKVLAINGEEIDSADGIRKMILASKGEALRFKVLRDGTEKTVELVPREAEQIEPDGFSFKQSSSFADALKQAFYYPVSVVKSTFKGVAMIFKGKIAAKDALSGPVAMVAMMGNVVKENLSFVETLKQLLMLFGLISVAVGFTNFLPIPPLDGHHLFILIIESIIRRDLPVRFKVAVSYAGFALLIVLAIYALYIDIMRLFF